MKRLVDRFAGDAAGCAGLEQLRALLEAVTDELGFDFFALLHHSSLDPGRRPGLRIDNYPCAWAAELVAGNLARADPVHLSSRRSSSAFGWAEIGSIVRLGDREKGILDRSRYHGIGDGLTVPANVPLEPCGSCSFAVRRGRDLPRQRLLCAELVGAHAFRAARRIMRLPKAGEPPRLSAREVECLRLVAAGKTDWEAATILGISVETARQYVKRARTAYDVATRTQLVVHGLRDEWVTFEEAIPPSG
jgi:LuxR family quorum-sensing system transcriptional regulator CciR